MKVIAFYLVAFASAAVSAFDVSGVRGLGSVGFRIEKDGFDTLYTVEPKLPDGWHLSWCEGDYVTESKEETYSRHFTESGPIRFVETYIPPDEYGDFFRTSYANLVFYTEKTDEPAPTDPVKRKKYYEYHPQYRRSPYLPNRPVWRRPMPMSRYSVTVCATPSDGGTASGGGVFYAGNSCTVDASPNDGFEFTGWTGYLGSIEEQQTSFNVFDNIVMYANFRRVKEDGKFCVNTFSDPAEGGSTSGGGNFEQGSSFTLRVSPKEGFDFLEWTSSLGRGSVSGSPTLSAIGDEDWTAKFVDTRKKVVVTVEPEEAGDVLITNEMTGESSGDGEIRASEGDQLTITVNEYVAYRFDYIERPDGTSERVKTVSGTMGPDDETWTAHLHRTSGLPLYDGDNGGLILHGDEDEVMADW